MLSEAVGHLYGSIVVTSLVYRCECVCVACMCYMYEFDVSGTASAIFTYRSALLYSVHLLKLVI